VTMRETLEWIAQNIGPEYATLAEQDARRAGLGPVLDGTPFPTNSVSDSMSSEKSPRLDHE
jgi:hypothetical protein